jgi:hypothetical protein
MFRQRLFHDSLTFWLRQEKFRKEIAGHVLCTQWAADFSFAQHLYAFPLNLSPYFLYILDPHFQVS